MTMGPKSRIPAEQSPSESDRHPWTAEARAFVQNKQEDEYRTLAAALGLGLDPKQAYEKLSRPPLKDAAADLFIKNALKAGIRLPDEERPQVKAGLDSVFQYYFSLKPPTSYESQNRYSSMVLTFDGLDRVLAKQGRSLKPVPLLASLPSGDINARIMFAPGTRVPILFFEQALFSFFSDFARVAGWAFPPISPNDLYNDEAIRRLPTRYTMPPEASEYFVSILYAYVVDGSTTSISSSLPPAPHNLFMSMGLLQEMEWFIMGHELAHLILGHLEGPRENSGEEDRTGAWRHEYAADLFSLDLMIEMAKERRFDGMTEVSKEEHRGWAFSFWACDLALTLFTCLYRAISLLEFGTPETEWISQTHPDPASRRACLRGEVLQNRSSWRDSIRSRLGLGTAAGTLCSMTDALLSRLFEMSVLAFFEAHQQKIHPSPIWENTIASSFKSVTGGTR
jgi:hypothetical protein